MVQMLLELPPKTKLFSHNKMIKEFHSFIYNNLYMLSKWYLNYIDSYKKH